MDEEFFARLINSGTRRAVLTELHREHRDQGAPENLSRYFIVRLEEALVFFDQHPRRCAEEIESLGYDFGYMKYFDRTLAQVQEGISVCYRAMGYEFFDKPRDQVA